jgi:hypothetical protein
MNPRNESLNTVDGFVSQIRIRDARIQIFSETNPNWLATNPDSRNESMDSQDQSTFLRISYTIPASLIITQTTHFKSFLYSAYGSFLKLFKLCYCSGTNLLNNPIIFLENYFDLT